MPTDDNIADLPSREVWCLCLSADCVRMTDRAQELHQLESTEAIEMNPVWDKGYLRKESWKILQERWTAQWRGNVPRDANAPGV